MHFHIPVLPDVLSRPRLYRLMETHRHCRIVLVTGQAAQGKSTMVADYLMQEKSPSLWFHLTPAASDIGVLFDLLLKGLEQITGSSGQSPSFPHASLGTRQDLPRQAEIMVAALNRMKTPLRLVLDDMESLEQDASSLGLIQALLADSPETVRFFLISRTLPDLNLSRFKMKQELLELTNEDLAFTLEETLAFFKETGAGRSGELDQASVEKVLAATNGWAGGLVLVSESVRRGGLDHLPDHLSSEVFSYFSQEIYQHLPGEIRTFLKQTALFEELDTRVLSLLFRDTDPVALLNRLEERNLFIQKIIPHSKWPVFKYNNLFREFLLADLSRAMDREDLHRFNQRIGQVFWEEKDHEKAIPFFMAARAHDMVADILRIKGTDYVITGRTDRLTRWIDALPDRITQADPWLIFFRTMAGRIRGGKKNIQAFNRALALFRDRGDTRGILLSLAYLIEASVFIRQPSREILKHIEAGEKTLAGLGGKYRFTWARTLLWQQIGLGYIAGTGDIPKGISACRNAILLAQGIENQSLVLNASVILTLGLVQSGDFAGAREMLEKTRAISQEDSQPEYRALENITNIDLALKRGNTELAGDLLTRSEADIEKFGLIFLYPGLVEARAVYYASMGQFDLAVQTADHLYDFSILEGNNFYQGAAYRIKAMVRLFQGDFSRAGTSAEKAISELGQSRRGDIHLYLARQILGLALFRQGKFSRSRAELTAAADYFSRIGSDLSFCETVFILGLLALEDRDGKERASRLFQAGIEKAVENQYQYFPLLDPGTLGIVLVLACEHLAAPEACVIPYVRQIETPAVLWEIQARIIDAMDRWPKKEKTRMVERFLPLFKAACPRLFIRTLGQFSVRLGHTPVPVSAFGGAKPLMLLKTILLKGGQDVPKEMLIDALWPDATPEAGEKNLKINLHRLRKALEPFARKEFGHVFLIQKAGRVSLDPDQVSVDAVRFDAWAAQGRSREAGSDREGALDCYLKAAGLYQGDYFSDDPYLDDAGQAREMYRRTCIDILDRKARIHEELDQWQEAVDTWHRVLEIDSCHEGACQNLMMLFGDAGLRTEAVQIFTRCRAELKKELEAEPSDRTLALFERITRART